MTGPSLANLVRFLKSILTDDQIDNLALMLKDASAPINALDPEAAPIQARPAPTSAQSPAAKPAETPAVIYMLLDEMESACSIDKFPPPSVGDARRVRDLLPNFINQVQANQMREIIKRMRERLGQ